MFEHFELGTEAGRSNVGILEEAVGEEREEFLELEETTEADLSCITLRPKVERVQESELLCLML